MALEIIIKRLDETHFLVMIDNSIANTFHESEYGNMLKYISSFIKKLEQPNEFKMFNPMDLAKKIHDTKKQLETDKNNKKTKNNQTKLI